MKVLQVIPSIGPQRGGTSIWLRSIAPRLAAEGIDIHVATTDDDGPGRMPVPLRTPVLERGVTYWFFPRQSRFYTFSFPLSAWLSRHVAEFDVVHIHALFSWAPLPGAYWARRRGVPYIVQPHGMLCKWGMTTRRPLLKKYSLRCIEGRILGGSAAVNFTNQGEMREASQLGIAWRPVVIPLATDLDACAAERLRGSFRARHGLGTRPVILFLSRFDPKKNLPLLFEAFARVEREHPEAVLALAGAGDPSFVRELEAVAAGLGIGDRVLWAGFLEGEEKIAALADADVFVLPSHSENFGIATVEAMCLGTPVVVSEFVGIHQEIGEAGAGLVAPCDAPGLAAALGRILASPSLRAQMGARARELARREFSMAAVTGRLIELYRSAAVRA